MSRRWELRARCDTLGADRRGSIQHLVNGPPAASVIVRARDEASTVGRVLSLLHRQTVRPEIIVVDSGSTDGTDRIAGELCDRLIRIAPHDFTYGYALNMGAAAASADVHFALSAHCFPPDDEWIARSLALYARADVAGTGGHDAGTPEVFYQDHGHARTHPHIGFSNHASSWRADVWHEFPFDERLGAAEDKEWGLRVTRAGWVLAFSREVNVDMSHAWCSARELFVRERRCASALASFGQLGPYGLDDLARDWWNALPRDHHSRAFHRFVNYRRWAGLAGRWLGVHGGLARP